MACPVPSPSLTPAPEAHCETWGTHGLQRKISLLARTLVPRTSRHLLRWAILFWSTAQPDTVCPPRARRGGTGKLVVPSWWCPRPIPTQAPPLGAGQVF